MTEAAHQMTANFLPPGIRKPGSIGKGRGVDVIILSEDGSKTPNRSIGEICVRGRNVFTAYHNNPKATAESFVPDPTDASKGAFFRTGDLGYIDDNGFIFLVGRSKEMINRGGEKISPLEIDNTLLQYDGVAEAVAFGVTNELYGQVVHACVILRAEVRARRRRSDIEKELKELCSKKLIVFKVPQKIWIVDEIPKGPTGKVQRRIVAEVFGRKWEELIASKL